jgi:Spy/CpxP family protein refolding chaperone
MLRLRTYFSFILLFASADLAFAQNDPLADALFAPELIMQHQQAIGLTEEQKTHLKNEARKAQVRFTELQWELQDEMEKLLSLVKRDQVDEQQVLGQLDKVLDVERKIKHIHINLALRIKNSLTSDQQAKLREIKNKPHAR